MRTGILFDLDGTLLDTLDDLCDATNYALSCVHLPPRTRAEVRAFVGNGVGKLIERAVDGRTDPQVVLAHFTAYYGTHCRIKTAPYPGIADALRTLGAKYPLAIVSNKPDSAVKALCNSDFPGIFALGESASCPCKPAPDMVRKAMDAIGVDRCIYVGDSEVDILTAKNADALCLSVLWGFRDRDVLEKSGGTHFCQAPDRLASSVETLIATLP